MILVSSVGEDCRDSEGEEEEEEGAASDSDAAEKLEEVEDEDSDDVVEVVRKPAPRKRAALPVRHSLCSTVCCSKATAWLRCSRLGAQGGELRWLSPSWLFSAEPFLGC